MKLHIGGSHAPGLMVAELLTRCAISKDQASTALQAAFNLSRVVRLAETNLRDGGFCGDPYVHDCGREHCPTSDSYAGPTLPLPRPTFETDEYLGPNAINPALLDGFALMPLALTAENGAKAAMLGEFSFTMEVTCSACSCPCDGQAEDCEVCDGDGTYNQKITVPWETIKDIYAAAVALFAKDGGAKA